MPITRRRVLLLRSVAVMAALGIIWWIGWSRPTSPGQVAWYNVSKIKKGMTIADAEELLARPSGDYCTAPIMTLNANAKAPTPAQQPAAQSAGMNLLIRCRRYNEVPLKPGHRCWLDDGGFFAVAVDADGIITDTEFVGVCKVPPIEVTDIVRRWLAM